MWFDFLVTEVKADRQKIKIKKHSGQKVTLKKIVGSKSLCEYWYFTLL